MINAELRRLVVGGIHDDSDALLGWIWIEFVYRELLAFAMTNLIVLMVGLNGIIVTADAHASVVDALVGWEVGFATQSVVDNLAGTQNSNPFLSVGFIVDFAIEPYRKDVSVAKIGNADFCFDIIPTLFEIHIKQMQVHFWIGNGDGFMSGVGALMNIGRNKLDDVTAFQRVIVRRIGSVGSAVVSKIPKITDGILTGVGENNSIANGVIIVSQVEVSQWDWVYGDRERQSVAAIFVAGDNLFDIICTGLWELNHNFVVFSIKLIVDEPARGDNLVGRDAAKVDNGIRSV